MTPLVAPPVVSGQPSAIAPPCNLAAAAPEEVYDLSDGSRSEFVADAPPAMPLEDRAFVDHKLAAQVATDVAEGRTEGWLPPPPP
jgi:hypothetical protein